MQKVATFTGVEMEAEDLQGEIERLMEMVDQLNQLITEMELSGKDWDSTYLSVNELSKYIKIPVSTIYKKVDELPRYKFGKRLLFKKDDVDKLLNSCRIDSNNEIRAKALSSILREELDG